MAINMMKILGKVGNLAANEVTRLGSSDVATNKTSWSNRGPAGYMLKGSRLISYCVALSTKAVSDAARGIDGGTLKKLKLLLSN